MIRKLIIALGATVVLGAAALSPTTASAWGHGHWGHGWHGGYGYYGFGPTYVGGSDCYRVKRLVETPFGMRWRRVLVCN
jgi:hypothetical protein